MYTWSNGVVGYLLSRDTCAEGLFDEGSGDLSLPVAILESFMKVHNNCLCVALYIL